MSNENEVTYFVEYADDQPDALITVAVEDIEHFEDEWENDDNVRRWRVADEQDIKRFEEAEDND